MGIRLPLDWQVLSGIDPESLKETGDQDELDRINDMLLQSTLIPDDITQEKMMKLFQICQVMLEVKHSLFEAADKEAEELEHTVKQMEHQIILLENMNQGGDISAEIKLLKTENEEIIKENSKIQSELAKTEGILEKHKFQVHELTEELAKEKAEKEQSEQLILRLKGDLEEYRTQIASQKTKLASVRTEEDDIKAIVKEKNKDINRYIHEIQILTSNNSQMNAEIEALGDDLQEAVKELERNAKEQDEIKNTMMEYDRRIDTLIGERDALEERLEHLSQKSTVEKEGSQLQGLYAQSEKRISQYKHEVEELHVTIAEYEQQVEYKEKEIQDLQVELASFNRDFYEKELSNKEELIRKMEAKLEESYKDFQLLSLDWNEMDLMLKKMSQMPDQTNSLHQRFTRAAKIKEELLKVKELCKVEREKRRKSEKRLKEREKEIIELQLAAQKYEQGEYGLSQALKELKEAKLQKSIRDLDILDLSKQITELQKELDSLLDENEAYKEKLGLKDNGLGHRGKSSYAKRKAMELEQLRSMNMALKKENDQLEEERIKLKSQLRFQALQRGTRAIELGLNAEDMLAVEEFAEGLRTGDRQTNEISEKDTAKVNIEQFERLVSEYENVNNELSAVKQLHLKLEKDNRALRAQNSHLQGALKEVSRCLLETVKQDSVDPLLTKQKLIS